jgi:PKD repeat protein
MRKPSVRTQVHRGVASALALAAILGGGVLAGGSSAAEGDVGYRGPSTAGISASAPTGQKPESKIWWNDGYWWANMWSAVSGSNHIFRLDGPSQTWVDTGVQVDTRSGTRADVLSEGNKLYIASHEFSNTAGFGKLSYLYRFSYDTGSDSYSLDSGFPATINNSKSEALVIDRDSGGKLWATWMQGGQVMYNRTLSSDSEWGTPAVLPVDGASGAVADDMSSLVAFNGRIGVMWSNQTTATMYWAEHVDGTDDATWQPSSAALVGGLAADDHINLKADSSGRVFAATKTSETVGAEPLTVLLARDPATGAWQRHVFGRKADRHTRPIVVLDQTNRMIHMYATAPEAGGMIYRKSTSMDAISFAPGRGKLVMQDPTSNDINDATSTKQPVTTASGLVVLASNDTSKLYWHSYDSLVLGADFTVSRTSGLAPLSVQFLDNSSGYPTSWQWDFGDGTTSTEQNPSHTYASPGTYTVGMTATDGSGASRGATRAGLVTVYPSVATPAAEDAYVNSAYPDRNYATYPTLRVRYGGTKSTTVSYMKFNVSGLAGRTVTGAKLRLYVADKSSEGGTVHEVPSSWSETAITWPTAPPITSPSLASVGAVALDTWQEVELPAGAFAAGDGTYSLAIQSTKADDAWYSSREGGHPPELVLGYSG